MTDRADQTLDSIARSVEHRPWPCPLMPWIMTQTWDDLPLLHYARHLPVLFWPPARIRN
jgi:hypothetical protein